MSRLNLTSWQRRRLRRQLAETRDARLYRRTLAVLELDHGRSAADIARMLGVTRQSVHNWAAAFTHEPDPLTLRDEGPERTPGLSWPSRPSSPAVLDGPVARRTSAILTRIGRCPSSGRQLEKDTGAAAIGRDGAAWAPAARITSGSGHATSSIPTRSARKKRRIRWQIRALPRRSVVLAQDETDLMMFPPLRAGWSLRGEAGRGPTSAVGTPGE